MNRWIGRWLRVRVVCMLLLILSADIQTIEGLLIKRWDDGKE